MTFEEESFGLLAKNFRLTCQYYIPCIQNHFPRWNDFLFSLIQQIFRNFLSSFGRKIQKIVGNILTGLLMLRSSCRERNLTKKKILKPVLQFFRILSLKDFVLLAKCFSRDVRNAFHVSRVPFRENFLFGEINVLMDNSANCAVDIRILVRTSQHGCQIYSLVVRRDTLSYFFWTKCFSIDSRIWL